MNSKARRARSSQDGSPNIGAGVHQRGDHLAVPVGQDLVVEPGPHPRRAHAEQLAAQRGEPRLVGGAALAALQPVEDGVAFEIAGFADVVMLREERGVVLARACRRSPRVDQT